MPSQKHTGKESHLILGWQVSPTRDPLYWRSKDAKPGDPGQDTYLAKVPAHTMATHIAIIAQSGSGKSFFLGRLIEELMLRTKARCIVLDPNADFRKIDEVTEAKLWQEAGYDTDKRSGKLPHEVSRQEFEQQWANVSVRVRGMGTTKNNYEGLKLWLPALSMEFLGEDLDPMLRSDLYHCHSLVQSLELLWKSKTPRPKTSVDLFAESQKLFSLARTMPQEELRASLEKEFLNLETTPPKNKEPFADFFGGTFSRIFRQMRILRIRSAIERILSAPKYTSPEVERFYFGKVSAYVATRVLETHMKFEPAAASIPKRLEVIDLPSLPDKNTRLLAINAILTTEWEEARKAWSSALEKPESPDTRVPTFIVVDEAHNLISAEPRTQSETVLREQFRTIVAEGRKYGLFLIIVSQRPDKLDPLILSECENKAVMRIGSSAVLNITRQMLGLDDIAPKMLERCLEFETGRVLLIGRWAQDEPKVIYSAARRTIEGGRNLRESYWAVPPEPVLPKDNTPPAPT